MSARKMLIVDSDKCTGCRLCEISCSFHHEKVFQPARARINVQAFPKHGFSFPEVCMKCDEMHCAAICEPKAITKSDETGVMYIDNAACTGCKRCISACRYGGIAYDWVADKALICDLCDGDPTCVHNCWSSALAVIDVEDSPDLRTTALEEARYRHDTYCQVVIPE